MQVMKKDWALGTGAALNIEVGFIPDFVIVENITDGDVINYGHPSIKTMAYTSGGTNEIKAGDTIKGATSLATARVKKVLLASGTWAGGDAAGTLILEAVSITGTFTSEAIRSLSSSATDDATGAAAGTPGEDSDTEVASDTGISSYLGSSGSASHGFTINTGISESGKLLAWTAFRNAAG